GAAPAEPAGGPACPERHSNRGRAGHPGGGRAPGTPDSLEGGAPMSERTWSPEVRDIGDRIASLTIARAAELHQYLENVYGVRVPAAPTERRVRLEEPEPTPPPAPTAFRVVLEGFEPARKISVIKVVRELTALGLKEAKDLVEGSPCVVR